VERKYDGFGKVEDVTEGLNNICILAGDIYIMSSMAPGVAVKNLVELKDIHGQ